MPAGDQDRAQVALLARAPCAPRRSGASGARRGASDRPRCRCRTACRPPGSWLRMNPLSLTWSNVWYAPKSSSSTISELEVATSTPSISIAELALGEDRELALELLAGPRLDHRGSTCAGSPAPPAGRSSSAAGRSASACLLVPSAHRTGPDPARHPSGCTRSGTSSTLWGCGPRASCSRARRDHALAVLARQPRAAHAP